MLSPGELSQEHIKRVVKSMDPERTGKVGLRELVTFVRARQGAAAAESTMKKAETCLRR